MIIITVMIETIFSFGTYMLNLHFWSVRELIISTYSKIMAYITLQSVFSTEKLFEYLLLFDHSSIQSYLVDAKISCILMTDMLAILFYFWRLLISLLQVTLVKL